MSHRHEAPWCHTHSQQGRLPPPASSCTSRVLSRGNEAAGNRLVVGFGGLGYFQGQGWGRPGSPLPGRLVSGLLHPQRRPPALWEKARVPPSCCATGRAGTEPRGLAQRRAARLTGRGRRLRAGLWTGKRPAVESYLYAVKGGWNADSGAACVAEGPGEAGCVPEGGSDTPSQAALEGMCFMNPVRLLVSPSPLDHDPEQKGARLFPKEEPAGAGGTQTLAVTEGSEGGGSSPC